MLTTFLSRLKRKETLMKANQLSSQLAAVSLLVCIAHTLNALVVTSWNHASVSKLILNAASLTLTLRVKFASATHKTVTLLFHNSVAKL
jgi:uncharacterized ion transporter superfamily protein YfcC